MNKLLLPRQLFLLFLVLVLLLKLSKLTGENWIISFIIVVLHNIIFVLHVCLHFFSLLSTNIIFILWGLYWKKSLSDFIRLSSVADFIPTIVWKKVEIWRFEDFLISAKKKCFPFWAAAPKGSMTYAFTHMGDFLLYFLLCPPPSSPSLEA